MRLLTYCYIVYLLAPIALLLVGAFGDQWSNTLLPHGFTGRWFAAVWEEATYRNAMFTTLKLALLTCVIDVLLVVPLVYCVTLRFSALSQGITRLLVMLPIAVPQLVIGFAFVLAFSSALMPWLGSSWLLIAGHVVVTFSYLFYTVQADIDASPLKAYVKMADSLGASSVQRFFHLYLPLVSRSVFTGSLTVAALSIGEFELSNLISGFLTQPYPVVLIQAFYRATGFACAATLFLLSLALLFSLFSTLVQRRLGRPRSQEPAS
ncbi:ABC transporter permease [Halomonas sp. GD1P12]|uniref:ABC transporter permease n=1 Tax=Halomonas sp. GD1P12 TaxID=2982691 RepID=UPI0021E49C57|nr:ABC transporter permease subunit [Halomonas sp. GD1P12]UYG00630.1 ABC transporter permease subunit [Halomonas sp. GD1P12]